MSSWLRHTRQLFQQPGFTGLLAATFALGMGFSFVFPFLSLWGTQAVGFTPFQFGVFMTLTSLSSVCVTTLLARWSDTHVPRKVMLLLGSASGVLGYTGFALTRQPLVLVGLGVTLVAFASICFSQLFATARDWFAVEGEVTSDVAITLSVVRVCFSFAWTAGPALGAAIVAHFDFVGLFAGAAALYLLFHLGVWRFVPYQRRPAHVVAAAGRVSVWRTLRRPDLLGYFVAFVLVFAAFAMNMMNLPLAITHELGGTAGDLGLVFAVGPAVEIPLMLWFGQLAARGHQLVLIRLGGCTSALYFVLLFTATEVWHVCLMQMLSGMSLAIVGNVAITFFQDLLPEQPGLATTVFANSSSLGNLVGYVAFGALATPLGSHGLIGACALIAIVASLALLWLRPGRPAPAAATVPVGIARP
ncbi:sugar efflux transporter [Opitutus terrae]|uniref:Major facilitator superfamily MFS_1 n=1 Tax=Opitutus terrae (strain DSM 11246 / JCM 15787 / PB90-1) TaxID=452637 RepID=B1ZNL7_OPITP|nr:sugar efflux transporter [Opitutus terrae]ACB74451.1 major facilitator superfamily MFS_1 [Opitutus terrae PB90-1]